MKDWWKNPVLQGPENDYGDYDYLINELPANENRWLFSNYKIRCDSCGKERYIHKYSCHYFHTLDGYDSMSYYSCALCESGFNSMVHRMKRKLKGGKR